MAVSYANIDASKMELTPMRVSFQGPGATAFTDLGGTLSNVVIDIKYSKADIKADQFGTSFIDKVNSGLMVTVTTEITQVQDKALWEVVFPPSVKNGTAPTDTLLFTNKVGQHDSSVSGQLVLHPLSQDNTNLNLDYYFYKATASAESQITYGPDNQARLKVVWNIFPDTSVTPARYFVYGDESLVP